METLRITTKEAAGSLRKSTFWVVNFGVTAVCVLSGPFGTFEALPSGFRLVYWGLIVLSASALAVWAHALIRTREWVTLSRISMVSIAFGLVVAGVVILLSLSLLLPIRKYPGHIELLSYSFTSATVIFFLSALLARSLFQPDDRAKEENTTIRPALFKRLERYPDARKILSLSAQDHYVEVTTELGAELCLLRFNDAIAEVKPEEGFQIHRSHWVAKSAVKKVINNNLKPQALLIDGRILSISQSRLVEFRKFLGSTERQ